MPILLVFINLVSIVGYSIGGYYISDYWCLFY
jgi:hypothetical protein